MRNLRDVVYYLVKDIIRYIKNQEWKVFKEFGIDMYVGGKGQGKTQSAVEYIDYMYRRYGVTVMSSTPLLTIPFKPLNNYHDIMNIDDENGIIILMDEAGVLMSNREWAKFPVAMVLELFQLRKNGVKILLTSPDYNDVDIILRKHTDNVIYCSRVWRLQNNKTYSGKDVRNCNDTTLLVPLSNRWWFIRDKYRQMYRTRFKVKNPDDFKAENYITNKELVEATGTVDTYPSMARLNKRGKKRIRNK